jgi:hypothetical protein
MAKEYKATYVFNYKGKDYIGYKWFDTAEEATFFLKKQSSLSKSSSSSRKQQVKPNPSFEA